MSGPTPEKASLGPPPRWLRCPRRGQLLTTKFLPFKTPLCSLYDSQIPEQYRFTVPMVFAGHRIGLWIDLTNTDRFYGKDEVENMGAKYIKLNCRGHGECPSEDQTRLFIRICTTFFRDHPDEIIAIHCTHGFNRTGFLICSYLISTQDWSVEAALVEFSQSRPPGIYKQDYIDELFKRYGDIKDAMMAPALPEWCDEIDPVLDDNEAEASANGNEGTSTRSKKSRTQPEFVEGVPSVHPVSDPNTTRRIQRLCHDWCGCGEEHRNIRGFPGLQPVSMTVDNIRFLQQQSYMVSWKADGVRYMMLINGPNEIYMIDRNNDIFHVPTLRFPRREDLNEDIVQTLVDGELIFDEAPDGKRIPRYLIYDVIRFEGKPIREQNFLERLKIIQNRLIGPRNAAKEKLIIDSRLEPFSVRMKDFYPVTGAEKFLSQEFRQQGVHEFDGLIFQPTDRPYLPGRCDEVLKWKPHDQNSIDFLLKIENPKPAPGMLPEKKGCLYVSGERGQLVKYGEMKVTKEVAKLDKKIIECAWDSKKGWTIMRERKDKSYPNAYLTAQGVMFSIQHPVTKDLLLDFIRKYAKKSSNDMQQPQKRPHPPGDEHQAKKSAINGERNLMPPPAAPR